MRERAHMTQDEFATALHQAYGKAFAKSTISGWELGNKNPPIEDNEFINALARVFNVSPADVLKGSGYELGEAYGDLDEARRRLLEAYDSGDLERLVIEALRKKGLAHSRLESDDESAGQDAVRRR